MMLETALRILLVDDHEIIREALAQFLDSQEGIDVICSVGNHQLAVSESERLQPDIALLDIEVPGLDSFAAAREISACSRDTKVIFLSAFCRDRYIEQAIQVGAAGYIVKGEEPSALLQAIEVVAGGATYFSPEVENRLVVGEDGLRLAQQGATRSSALTLREREILGYIAVGMSKKEIASLLEVSVRTVDAHVRNIMGKLDLHDRVELARFAVREGLAPE